jgi:hypothetical protein
VADGKEKASKKPLKKKGNYKVFLMKENPSPQQASRPHTCQEEKEETKCFYVLPKCWLTTYKTTQLHNPEHYKQESEQRLKCLWLK